MPVRVSEKGEGEERKYHILGDSVQGWHVAL